ncbi:MAG: glycosyltransferase family 4 protein [Thermoplasmata archaeon]|nr:glycosyltransferase family 4 protein [Thermoplasmata archaeon]
MRDGSGSKPRLLVLYPAGLPHYADRELLALLPRFDTTFVVPEDSSREQFTTPPALILPARYRRVPGLAPFNATVAGGLPDLETLIDRTEPDLVATYELFSALTHQVTKTPHRSRFFHLVVSYETTRAPDGAWGHYPLARRWAKDAVRHADLLLVHTERARDALREFGAPPEKLWLNPPGIYVRDSVPARGAPRVPGPLRALFVGGLRRNKGVLSLLAAIRELASVHAEFRFVGDGPLEGKLRAAARADPRILVEGRLSETEKQVRLDTADLFVYPSEDLRLGPWIRWEEQTATSVLEAMEAGLPALGTSSGALPEIIGDPTMVVPQHSPAALAGRLRELLSDPPELGRRGRGCRERARTRFNLRLAAVRADEELFRRWGTARSAPRGREAAPSPDPGPAVPRATTGGHRRAELTEQE